MTDNAMFRNYKLTLTSLTPLTIGNGRTMQQGIDFLQHKGYVWIANEEAIFESMLEKLAGGTDRLNDAAAKLAGIHLDDMVKNGWLPQDQINLSSGLFHYRLKGQVPGEGGKFLLREFIKDVYGQPYIPGSGIKGSIRSAVLRYQARPDSVAVPRINYVPSRRGSNPKKADDLEDPKHFVPNRNAYGSKEPNYSLWRTLRVSDSDSVDIKCLILSPTFMVHKKPPEKGAAEVSMAFEAIPAGFEFKCDMWGEDWLMTDERASKLSFTSPSNRSFKGNLVSILRRDSRKRLEDDINYFGELLKSGTWRNQKEVLEGIGRQYDLLATEYSALKENETMLQIGRGTGWRSKTMGDVLIDRLPRQEFAKMVKEFNLGRGYWQQNGPIPFTHLMAETATGSLAPMGWVRIAVDEVK